MRRIMLTVAYDGTNYCGWQIQPTGITIEEVLNQKREEKGKLPINGLQTRMSAISFMARTCSVIELGKSGAQNV